MPIFSDLCRKACGETCSEVLMYVLSFVWRIVYLVKMYDDCVDVDIFVVVDVDLCLSVLW